MPPMFKKLVRGVVKGARQVSNFFQKGGHEVMFRKIKNTIGDIQPLANSVSRLAGDAVLPLTAINPSLGSAALGFSEALPRMVSGMHQTAADFQEASRNKRPRADIERPRPSTEQQIFE